MIPGRTNKKNFNFVPVESWKKPRALGRKPKLEKLIIGLFPEKERKTKKLQQKPRRYS